MPENYKTKLVLFDLDGTLIDTAPDFLSSLNNVLDKYNKENVTSDEIRAHISEGSAKLIKFCFKVDYDDKNFKQYKSDFLLEYKNNLNINSKLFDGIKSLLDHLDQRSIMYGIVTNKYYEYAEPLVKSFPQLKNIKIIICPDHVSNSKPDPEGILLACKKLNVRPEETVYLGDHQNDLKAGLSAGTKIIGCQYGYSLQKDLSNYFDCPFVKKVSEIILNID
ncbi:MAG: phosphoglycolate phosphatase [Gammaproteobacteria bacterium]|nr:phosphoglycolate phosphatase [Gammaproteobacteria bacterium]|tara:strand:+ start:66009 stop:66671 length:663 start_codon:yes stop_codon:yes gene_type:complete